MRVLTRLRVCTRVCSRLLRVCTDAQLLYECAQALAARGGKDFRDALYMYIYVRVRIRIYMYMYMYMVGIKKSFDTVVLRQHLNSSTICKMHSYDALVMLCSRDVIT